MTGMMMTRFHGMATRGSVTINTMISEEAICYAVIHLRHDSPSTPRWKLVVLLSFFSASHGPGAKSPTHEVVLQSDATQSNFPCNIRLTVEPKMGSVACSYLHADEICQDIPVRRVRVAITQCHLAWTMGASFARSRYTLFLPPAPIR